MKKIFATIVLLGSLNSYSQAKIEVECGFNQCTPSNFTPILYLEQPSQTVIDVGDSNNKDIEVNLPVNQDPRKLILSVNNNSTVGQDVSVTLNSKQLEKNTEDFVLIGDIFKNVNVNLNGYTGQTGRDSSIICADRFKNGTYGLVSRDFFLNRRTVNPELSNSRCDVTDLQHIQNTKFSCEDEFSRIDTDRVEVSRIKAKQKCIGTSIKYKCLQRKVRLTCEWKSLARGNAYYDKYTSWPCSTRFGGVCNYNHQISCWTGDFNKAVYSSYSSFPPNGIIYPWSIEPEYARCNPVKATAASSGGWFAKQRTEYIIEQIYLNAVERNVVNNFCNEFPSPPNNPRDPAWKFNRSHDIRLTIPGLDPETMLPLPGSNWIVRDSDFFTTCNSLGLYDTMSSEIQSWIAFGEIGNECSDARVAEDTNNLIPWSKGGQEQDPAFGLQKMNCSVDNCPVQTVIADKQKVFDLIDPTVGANGTSQGNGILFVYDFQNLVATAKPGTAGNGGNNDLPVVIENRYCAKIDDALTQGLNSSFAKTPVVSFDLYKWQGLKINRGEAGGANPEFSKKKIKVYKKMDSSVRYLLQKEMI